MSTRSYDTGLSTADRRVIDDPAVRAALEGLPDEAGLVAMVALLDALADPTRLRIALALARRELCVCDLAALTGVSSSGVSHQLRLLRDRRIVAYRREGRHAVYRLADDHVARLLAIGLEHAAETDGGGVR